MSKKPTLECSIKRESNDDTAAYDAVYGDVNEDPELKVIQNNPYYGGDMLNNSEMITKTTNVYYE